MDYSALPYWNKGVYQLSDLPASHQAEIKAIIEARHRSDLVGKLKRKSTDKSAG